MAFLNEGVTYTTHAIFSVHPLFRTSFSPIWFFTWQQWKQMLAEVWVLWPFWSEVVIFTKFQRVNGRTQTPNQVQAVLELQERVSYPSIAFENWLRWSTLDRSVEMNISNRCALLFLCASFLPSLPSSFLESFHLLQCVLAPFRSSCHVLCLLKGREANL